METQKQCWVLGSPVGWVGVGRDLSHTDFNVFEKMYHSTEEGKKGYDWVICG